MAACYIVRHGDTEWSVSGQHTSRTNLSLTEEGKARVRKTRDAFVGEGKVVEPSKVAAIYVSPLSRAQETLELLGLKAEDGIEVIVEDRIKEWDYGEYEGMTSKDIRAKRKAAGLDKNGRQWNIWQDGCEGGESPDDVANRIDELIEEIRTKYHGPAMSSKDGRRAEVVVVAHGHSLRSFAMRWIGKTLQDGPAMVLDAGMLGKLSYEHNSLDEGAICLGIQMCH